MINYFWFVAAAVFEIAGCYAFWAWFRLGKNVLWIIPGIASLMLFAFVLTRVEAQFAGRAYAAYGGIYIAASLLWLALIERNRPLLSDYFGGAVCLIGAAIILFGPRLSST
jgi:small multidrug resistance family-3 protein